MSRAERGGTADERLYARGFVALLVASFIVRFLCSGCVELTGDELMHWQWSRHLALGYPEHPPLIAWTISGVTRLFGTSERTVRAVSVVAMTTSLALAFALGRAMYGARAGFFGATALLITPIANAGGVLATTDALLCCFWTLTVHAVKKAVLDRRAAAWPAAGIAAGLALLTKLPALLLFPATAIVLLGTAEGRSQLRRPGPYVAATLAIVVFLPALVWNAEHGWVTLVMRLGHRLSPGLTLRPLGELITMQLIAVGPVLFAGFLWALWRCGRRGSDGRAVFLGAFGAVPFLFYAAYSLRASVDPHWPAVGDVTGFIALGAFATRGGAGRPSRAFVLAVSVPAALLVADLPSVS